MLSLLRTFHQSTQGVAVTAEQMGRTPPLVTEPEEIWLCYVVDEPRNALAGGTDELTTERLKRLAKEARRISPEVRSRMGARLIFHKTGRLSYGAPELFSAFGQSMAHARPAFLDIQPPPSVDNRYSITPLPDGIVFGEPTLTMVGYRASGEKVEYTVQATSFVIYNDGRCAMVA